MFNKIKTHKIYCDECHEIQKYFNFICINCISSKVLLEFNKSKNNSKKALTCVSK